MAENFYILSYRVRALLTLFKVEHIGATKLHIEKKNIFQRIWIDKFIGNMY
jgi:hypothetical protein